MDNLNKISKEIFIKTLYLLIMKILLEVYFRFIAQIITYSYIIAFLNNFNKIITSVINRKISALVI